MNNEMLNSKPSGTIAISRMTRNVLRLFKLRIGFMIMVTALVGLVVTPGQSIGLEKIVIMALTVLVASASAGAFNQYYERNTDHLMARAPAIGPLTSSFPVHRLGWS